MIQQDKQTQLGVIAAIAAIYQSIESDLSLEEIARLLVREIKGLINCDACAVMLIEDNVLKILSSFGFCRVFGVTAMSSDVPLVRCLRTTKQSMVTGNMQNNDFTGIISTDEMNSLASIPIIADDVVIGMIHLESASKQAFSEQDASFLRLMANGLSVAFKRSTQRIQTRDFHARDIITGCFNRDKFVVDIVDKIVSAMQSGNQLSLLILDIENISAYSEIYGPQKSDELLRKLAEMLRASLRPADRVYRYESEKFAIILPVTGKESALSAAQRLKGVIEQEIFYGAENSFPDGKFTMSITVLSFPVDARNIAELIDAADKAISQRKAAAIGPGSY